MKLSLTIWIPHFRMSETWDFSIICPVLWEPGYDVFVLWNRLKTSSCLANALAPTPIALESCSRAQTNRPVFQSALEKYFFGCGLRIFCEWRHKWSCFWANLADVAWPTAQPLGQVFHWSFHWKLGSSPSLLSLSLTF